MRFYSSLKFNNLENNSPQIPFNTSHHPGGGGGGGGGGVSTKFYLGRLPLEVQLLPFLYEAGNRFLTLLL